MSAESAATRYYSSSEVSNMFEIGTSTLRKWSLSLEKHDYEFTRGEQNRRLYSDEDLRFLKSFQQLIQVNNMSMENASIIVASRFKEVRSSAGTPSVREEIEQSNEDSPTLAKLTEHIEQQEKFNQELLRRLDEQNEYINKRLDQRDKSLTETMNQLLEQRKEEIKLLEEQNNKKGWLSRLFERK